MSTRSIFGRSKAIERKIDEFLDKVSECALVMVAMLQHALETDTGGNDDVSLHRVQQQLILKRACSKLRREIEAELYTEMLIPDLLADVANLIEALNRLVEDMHHAMHFAHYGRLPRPDFLRSDGAELTHAVGNAVEALVQGSRAYFRDFARVRDHVHKVSFYESESDAVRDRMLDKIYADDLTLAEQDHLARSVRELDEVADRAERISDMLTICAIKRSE